MNKTHAMIYLIGSFLACLISLWASKKHNDDLCKTMLDLLVCAMMSWIIVLFFLINWFIVTTQKIKPWSHK